jgi:biotin synthase
MPKDVPMSATPPVRHNWTREEIDALFDLPFTELLFQAQTVHRAYHKSNAVQASQLCSIKTGGCPEDCGYCNQSAKFDTGLSASKLMAVENVVADAEKAKAGGASRFCMGAAWREPKDRDMDVLLEMVSRVKGMGLETCMTLGMLTDEQATQLKDAGLDYYNHNIDTSPEYYEKVISTRTFEDRIETLERVRKSGMKVCCGGIVGMGEQAEDRTGLLLALSRMEPHPESVPVNALVPVRGTPLGDEVLDNDSALSGLDFARVIAVARIVMPASMVRLSAGREAMSDETQALCFLAGANSVFVGDELLTTANPGETRDAKLFENLGLELV